MFFCDVKEKTHWLAKRGCGFLVDSVYPRVCPLCGKVLSSNDGLSCSNCRLLIENLKSPLCFRCGKEIDDVEEEFCFDCKKHPRSFISGFPAMRYTDSVKKCVGDFKYKNKREFAPFFAREIIRANGNRISMVKPDVLIPVPVHKDKLKKRGYNQAEVLANELGKLLGVPVDNGVIVRGSKTLPQKELKPIERENNLKNAFIPSDKVVKYRCALLVDDIYTTGATIEACTKVLHKKGINNVYYTSICIGVGKI